MNLQSLIVNGVWIQEKYEGQLESGKGSGVTLTRKYQLRKKGDNYRSKTQEMHQTEAYASFQSFILRFQQYLIYQTNEGAITLRASKIKVDTTESRYPVYDGEATWVYDPRKPDYLTNPTTWSHRMIGGTRNVSLPVAPQRFYARPGVVPIHRVGVNWSPERGYEGVDAYSPERRLVAKQQLLASFVTDAYWELMYSLSKTVNAFPFRGLAPGSVLYLGLDSDEAFNRDNKVHDITHQFVIEPNLVNFHVDGIPVSHKWGHEYLWFEHMSTEAGALTTQVAVAPIYHASNFDLIGLS